MPIELPASLVEQLPVAALFVLCAAVAGRYAARLVDRLVAGQERLQHQLVEALERNTAAWRDTCAALTKLEAAVNTLPAPVGGGDGPGRSPLFCPLRSDGGRDVHGTPRREVRRRAAVAAGTFPAKDART